MSAAPAGTPGGSADSEGALYRAFDRVADSLRFVGEIHSDPRASVSRRFALARSIGREPDGSVEKKKRR